MADSATRIAIIGMAGRFPGASDTDAFWANLVAGHESIEQLSAERLRANEPDIDTLIKRDDFIRARGMLDDVDLFDARFFGFTPREATLLDPQHRFWLENAWTALEQAGVDPQRFAGPIGVFAGAGSMDQYLLHQLLHDRDAIEAQVKLRTPEAFTTMVATGRDFLPSRTAYKLNLRGPAVNVQTACSTSLVAIHLACQSLLAFESDVAIAGGVSIGLPQEQGYIAQEGGIRSLDGHCRAFDEKACGTVFSSGIGAFVLKRYEDALDDGNEILAVVRGSAINNDGADKVSFGAPSPAGQAEVIALAQAIADVHPDEIGYIEAHGTATPLGDPIEVEGLTRAWRRKSSARNGVLLGSVKSNIGHLDSAAGAAGLVKTIHALREGRVPATLHYTKPNPRIDFAGSPFRVVSELTDWPSDTPRIAGVSSFGVGGTNAHVIVEQAPEPPAASAPVRHAQLLVLSAKTPSALARRCGDLADWLNARPQTCLADVAWTLATGRADMGYRKFVVADSVDTAIAALREAVDSAHRCPPTQADQPPVAFLFPGQGAQHPGMGRALYDAPGVFRDTVDRLAGYLQPALAIDIRDLLYPPTSADADAAGERLRDTGMAQPALFVVELALARLWASWGIEPEAMLGHSVGEFAAACLAGVVSEAEACRVLAARARLMSDMPGGSMLALRRGEADIAPLLSDEIALAAINGPALCIVSGPDTAIDALADRLLADGEQSIRLHTSHAFHSSMMDAAVAGFTDIVAQADLRAPQQRFVSCVTGDWITDAQAVDPAYWARQLRETVRFSPALERLLEEPARIYLECGPSQNLSASTRQHRTEGQAPVCVASQAHASSEDAADHSMLVALGELWQAGVTPDWHGVFETGERGRRLVHLPTYAFDRERYWIDAPARLEAGTAAVPCHQATHPADAASVVASSSAGVEPVADGPTVLPSREQHLTALLRELLLELSGIDITSADVDRPFAALGMDSLFLTQVAAEISTRFSVTLRFRQLLDGIDTLARLATHLDGMLPADQFQPSAPPQDSPTAPGRAVSDTAGSLPAQVAVASAARDEHTSPTHRLFEQQLEIMRQQLAVLGGQPSAAASASADPIAPTALSEPGATVQARIGEARQGVNLAATAPGRFGPYKTINQERDGGLTATQQKFLDDLITNLSARTAGSKQVSADARSVLADPRGVANFRRSWKELVYQIVAERTDGARMTDIDGNEYVDITMGFGVGFMGHRHPVVVDALKTQIDRGFEVGPQTPLAPVVAEKFCRLLGHDRVSFCNTGSEAVMAALRCARTVTGRNKVVYFTGDYHGTFDEVLGRANIVGGELSTRPVAPGLVQDSVDNIMVLDYGTEASLDILRTHADEIAAVLIEPVQSRYPDLQPVEFVREVRRITAASGCALILDEVITGFRCALGGIKTLWDIDADICTYGKILGGGLPIGAVAGKRRWLDPIDGGAWQYGDDSAPEAAMTFFAGTFVRHPLVMAAADAVLDFLMADGGALQEQLNRRTQAFAEQLNAFFQTRGVPLRIRWFSSLFRFDIPQDQPFTNLLFYRLLADGIYIRDGAQNCFFSIAHTQADIARVVEAVQSAVIELQSVGFLPSVTNPVATASAQPSTACSATAAPDHSAWLPVGDSIPLTEAQREIWLAQAVRPEIAPAFNELMYFDLPGELDNALFDRAVQEVVQRHEAIWLRFATDGETQTRIAVDAFPVEFIDMSTQDDAPTRALAAVHALRETVFDLGASNPLLRICVIRLGPERTLVALVVHHLICDGWGGMVVFEELAATYSALVTAHTPDLAVPVAFSAYAREQFAAHDAAARQLDYWRAIYHTVPEPLSLPTREPRRLRDDAPAGGRLHEMPLELQNNVRSYASRANVTPYAIYMAAYAALLGRLAGQSEVVIAMPVAGQALAGHQALVGHCVQLLPLRIACEPDALFSTVLARVREAITKGCANADCTYGQIVRALNSPRDAARLPLAEVVFNFSPTAVSPHFGELVGTLHEPVKSAVYFDLQFNLTQSADSLLLHCDYNAHLFTAETVDGWISAYEEVLGAVAANADIALADLPVAQPERTVPPHERFNPEPIAVDTSVDLAGLIRAQAARTPAVIACAHASGHWSYRELDARSDAIAAALVAQGVVPGQLVGLCLPRTPAMLAGIVGILKAGAAYVPMDPDYPLERLRYIARDSGATRVLCWSQAPALGVEPIDIDQAMAAGGAAPDVAIDVDRPAYIIYTSGSTGQPKGVRVRHRNVLALLAWTRTAFADDEIRGMLAAASVCFDFSIFELFVPLTRGGSVVLVDNLLSLMQPPPAPVTLVSGVPSAMSELLDHTTLPTGVRTVCVGGEAVDARLVARVYAQPDVSRVVDAYGPTETTVFATTAERTSDGPVTIGRPLAGWRAYILDKHDSPVPVGTRGELVIGGAGVSAGYIDRDELTAERFVADPFAGGGELMYRTGDLASWREDGQIEYAGRSDNQIKIRGFRVELGEIEAALAAHQAVARCAVAVHPAGRNDMQIVAYWQRHDTEDAAVVDPAMLRRALRAQLPVHMVPQQFVAMTTWPTMASGKLDRKRLPSPFADRVSATNHDSAADKQASVRRMDVIIAAWSGVLGHDIEARSEDSFLDVGGHSLLAVRAVATIQRERGITIPVRAMMLESLAQLGARLDDDPASEVGALPDDAVQPSTPTRRGLAARLGFGKKS